MGVKGRMWHVINKMYRSSRSAVLLEGEKSDSFNVGKVWPRVVLYFLYYFQYSLMIC